MFLIFFISIYLFVIIVLLGRFHTLNHLFISSVRTALTSKLRGPGWKSRPGTVGGQVNIILWGARPGWKLALS